MLQTSHIFESSKVDRVNLKINNVCVLSSRSKNDRNYTKDALQSAIKVLEGVPAFYNHSYSGGRELKDGLIGNFTNIVVKGNKVYGDLNVLKDSAEFIFEIADRMPKVAGFSIDCLVRYEPGKVDKIIELVECRSIDLVVSPATTKGLFEEVNAVEKEKEAVETIASLKESLAVVKLENEKLNKQIKKMLAKESLDKELKGLKLEVSEDFKAILMDLDEAARKRILEEKVSDTKGKIKQTIQESVDKPEAVVDYVELIGTELGGV